MTLAGRFTIAADHPALPGHFPGRPVVPGVVLLDRVLEIVTTRRAVGMPSVKFTEPVRPGQEVEVFCDAGRGQQLGFRCTVGGAEVARGTVQLDASP